MRLKANAPLSYVLFILIDHCMYAIFIFLYVGTKAQ